MFFALRIILFAAAFVVSSSFLCRAEELPSSRTDIALEKIIITNRRSLTSALDTSENVVIFGEDEIAQYPSRNLGDLLAYVPGVDIEPLQGFGRAAAITIQGSDSRQVRMMIDGIPLNPQSSGQVDPAQFPIENIERIEVIKGGISSVWGSGLGGVINIITKDVGDTLIPAVALTNTFAEFRTQKKSLEVSGGAGDFGYYGMSSYMESAGTGPHDDVLEKKAFVKLGYGDKEDGKVVASFGYSVADVNGGEFPDGTWQSQPYRMRYGKLGWEKSFGLTDINIEAKHSRKELISNFYLTADDDVPYLRTEAKDLLYQLSILSNTRVRESDSLIFGADFDNDIVKSVHHLDTAKSLKAYAPYAHYTLKLEPWDINAGLRYDRNSEFGSQVSPSLGFLYRFKSLPSTLARAGVSRAFSAPPLLWKYHANTAFSEIANPDLRAERAWVYEAGVESQLLPALWCSFSLYRSDVKDAIETAENELGETYKKNFQKFRRQGAEFRGKVDIMEDLSFSAGAAFNDITDLSTEETVRGGGKPRQRFDAALTYKHEKGFRFSLIGYYYRWNALGSAEANDRKMLWDLKIAQDFSHLGLFLNVYNLGDSKYWTDYYYPLPGRYFEGGCTLKW